MKFFNWAVIFVMVFLPVTSIHGKDRGMTGSLQPENIDQAKKPAYHSFSTQRGDELTLVLPDFGLTESAWEAVAVAPDWLKDDLVDNLSYSNETIQNAVADMILHPSDIRYRDEYCFMAAHMAPEMLGSPVLDLIIFQENVSGIYTIAPHLDYVELVEYGDPETGGDYYTTVRHKWLIGEGQTEWREIQKEFYYWYIVHPKISDEKVGYVDPVTGSFADPPTGVFWRDYLWSDSDVTANYAEHFLETGSEQIISDEDLDNWGPSAKGYLVCTDIAPTSIAEPVSQPGHPVLADIKWVTGNYSSTILATTMRVESAYASGTCLVLENMTAYGNGHQKLTDASQIAVIKDQDQPEGAVIENVLTAQGRPYTVLTSTDIGVADLSGYMKIIIPSNQPRLLYQAIADNRTWIEDWLNTHRRVFEIHLATSDAEDPFGLVFPGGFTSTSQTTGTFDDIRWSGYPVLRDVVPNAAYYWDGVQQSFWGGRHFEPDSFALDVAGNWTGKILNYRARGDRPIQPAAVAWGHDGNCGELQDLLVATARTLLIPAQCVLNRAWDHVWGEFWADGEWRPYQVSWDRGNTYLDNCAVGMDSDCGSSKTLSAVTTWRGDHYKDAVTHRYSQSCQLHVNVKDSQGNPVDGAKVEIKVYPMGGSSGTLVTTIAQFTDIDGTSDFILGEGRDFWGSVISSAGNYPQGSDPESIITGSLPDAQYTWEVTVPDTVPQLDISFIDTFSESDGDERLKVSYEVIKRALHPMDIARQQTFSFGMEDGLINMFICDESNFNAYRNKQTFEAYNGALRSHSGSALFTTPSSDTWYVVFDTTDILFARQSITIAVDLERYDGSEWVLIESINQGVMLPGAASTWVSADLQGPACQNLGVTLEMPGEFFTPGSDFWLHATVCNDTDSPLTVNPLFVLLDVYGQIWFAPDWTQGVNYYPPPFNPGETELEPISLITWPETGPNNVSGIKFYGALLNEQMSDIVGVWSMKEFGWGP